MNDLPTPPQKTGPRDVFLHLLVIITLYISAVNFGVLLFQYINIYFPDPLIDPQYRPAVFGPLRFAIASLVIVFPLYIWLTWFLEREFMRSPEKRELKARKWLLNFTLFAAALIIVGDLIALVNRYLEGELTVRFVLKVLVVLSIAASVFWYYLLNLRRENLLRDLGVKLFVRALIVVVAIATIAGFFVAGSPQSERLRRFDERRVQDLQNIQGQIVNFWQQKNRLPSDLAELQDSISGYVPPRDPQDATPYEYRALDDLIFELCATFKTASTSSQNSVPKPAYRHQGPYQESFENWNHDVGRTCFQRTIDPELYAPRSSLGKPLLAIPARR